MLITWPTLGKYLVGMGASLLIFLAGGWLILAPFALGYQPYGADWVNQTTADFATGIPVLRQVKPLHHARRCYALWLWKS